MGIPFRYCTALIGGAAGALDAASIDDIQNKEMAFVMTSSTGYVYVFDTGSESAESSPAVIRPDDATGPGRWHVQDLGVVGGSDFSYAHFLHQEALGVSGGSRTKNIWNQRAYNTTVENGITDCTLSGGDISAPAGKYDFRIIDVQRNASVWRIKLLNVTTGVDICIGPSVRSSWAVTDNWPAMIQSRFTLTEAQTIGTRIISDQTHTSGMGSPSSIDSEKEVYGVFELWRIGEA